MYTNHFMVEDMGTLSVWLRGLGPDNIAHLQRIQIKCGPQQWDYASTRAGAKAQFGRYRVICQEVGKMIAVARNLESLQTMFYYHHEIKSLGSGLRRLDPVSAWIDLARKVAELLYDDFRPFFLLGLSRGRTPEQLCRIVKIDMNNWRCLRKTLNPPWLSDTDAERAESELVEHLRLLLEKNL
ncbi:hypothetical protein LY78DRAFT_662477 [Colletotrichum sublineola]|nr:hypothetical protein LY78DRAFT_662477 [Colletotrichum sublineola]